MNIAIGFFNGSRLLHGPDGLLDQAHRRLSAAFAPCRLSSRQSSGSEIRNDAFVLPVAISGRFGSLLAARLRRPGLFLGVPLGATSLGLSTSALAGLADAGGDFCIGWRFWFRHLRLQASPSAYIKRSVLEGHMPIGNVMNTLRTGLLMAALTGIFLAVGYLIGGGAGMVIAFLFAAGTNLFAYWNSDKVVLSMYGARQWTRRAQPA